MQSVIDFPWRWLHVEQTVLVNTSITALHTLVINYLDAGVVVTLYNGIDATGAVVSVINTALAQPVTLIYDAKLPVGLYITIAGEGAADLTVNFN